MSRQSKSVDLTSSPHHPTIRLDVPSTKIRGIGGKNGEKNFRGWRAQALLCVLITMGVGDERPTFSLCLEHERASDGTTAENRRASRLPLISLRGREPPLLCYRFLFFPKGRKL